MKHFEASARGSSRGKQFLVRTSAALGLVAGLIVCPLGARAATDPSLPEQSGGDNRRQNRR